MAEAEPLFRRAIELRGELFGEDHAEYARGLRNLALTFKALSRFTEAEPLLAHALEIQRTAVGDDTADYAATLNALAGVYSATRRYTQAETQYRRALEIQRQVLGEEKPGYAETLNDLAGLYFHSGRYREAGPHIMHARDVFSRIYGTQHASYALALQNVAAWYQAMGRFTEAEPLYLQALDIFTKSVGEEHRWHVGALANVALFYIEIGRFPQAEAVCKRVIEIKLGVLGRLHPDIAESLQECAALYRETARYEEAEAMLRQAQDIVRTSLTDEHPLYSRVLNELALLFQELGRFSEAEPLYDQAIRITRRASGDQSSDLALALTNMAALYQATGRFEQAVRVFREGLEIIRKNLGQDHPAYATALNNLALLYSNMDRQAEAEPLFREAIRVLENAFGERHPTHGTALHNLATVYQKTGRLPEAEQLYRRALDIRRQFGSDTPDYALELNNFAYFHHVKGSFADAAQTYRQALEIYRNSLGGQHPNYAMGLANLGVTLAALNQDTEALELWRESAQLQWSYFSKTFPTLSPVQQRQLVSVNDFEQSQNLSTAIFSGRAVPAELGLQATLLSKQLLFEADREASQALRTAVAVSSPQWLVTWQRREQLRREYATLALGTVAAPGHSRRTDGPSIDPARIRSLADDIDRLEQELRRTNPTYAAQARLQEVTLDDVTAAVRSGEAVVEYVRYQPVDFKTLTRGAARYGAYVLRGGSREVTAIDLGEATAIDAAVEAFRGAVRMSVDTFGGVTPSAPQVRRSEADIAQASAAVRALIWHPLEQTLGDAHRVYVAPDGALSLIPFEALARAEASGGWQYLVEERELVYLSTGRDLGRLALSRLSSTTGPPTAVLIGNPAFSATPPQMAAVVAGPQTTRTARAGGTSTSSTLGTVTAGAARHDVPRTWQQVPLLEQLVAQARQQLTRLGWTVRTLTNAQAVEEAVLDVQAPRLLQFATHGYILDKPATDPEGWDNPLLRSMLLLAGANTWEQERAVFYRVNGKMLTEAQARAAGLSAEQLATSRVELADGILTAYEVTGMNLQGTELVNLTACETGLGEVTPDGVVGLRQAFLLAGARALTMSMWEVPAGETTTQMGDFYQRWLGGPAARRATTTRYGAFRGAQLAALARARQTYGGGHPFYWAGTVYVGDPGDLPVVTP
jgi:tetratricopeptide (TPR) repeat protein/CHAT domain-containing protein